MNKITKTIIIGAVLLQAVSAQAGLDSPDAAGYMARARAMYTGRNYQGCIDQIAQLRNYNCAPQLEEQALYLLSMATLRSGDDEAASLLREFMLRYPQSPEFTDAEMGMGDYWFTRGNYKEALEWYDRVPDKAFYGKKSADLTYRRAYSEMLTGRNLAARPLFAQLLANGTYGNAAKFYLAYMDYQEQNFDSALKLFKDVDAKREPGNASPYYMAQIYFHFEDYKQALNLARKVIDSDAIPEFRPEANRIAGESLYNMGHMEEALPYLWKYAADCPDPLPSTLYILGVAEYNSGNYGNAAGLFQRATKAPGKIGQGAWLFLGQTYVKQNNADGALMAFEKAYTDGSDAAATETAFYNYIVARTQGGRLPFANTVEMLEDFLARYPRSRYAPTVQESLVGGYMSTGDYSSALKAIDRIANPSPALVASRQRVLFELGTRDYSAGDLETACRMFELAGNGPSAEINAESELWRANCEYDMGHFTEAAGLTEKYLDADSNAGANRLQAWYLLGYSRYKESLYPEAITAFRHISDSEIAPAYLRADATNRIADCLYQERNFQAAAFNYGTALELDPDKGDYPLYQQSVMLGLQGKRTEQIKCIDILSSDYPTSALVPAGLLDKAEALALSGRTGDAVSTYRNLIREYGNGSYGRQGYLQLALTLYNAGEKEEAVRTYKEVVYSYPTSAEAKLAVDDLKRIYGENGELAQLNEFLESVPNAPLLSPSEIEALAFQNAENSYLNTGKTDRLEAYLAEYANGSSKAAAHYYLAEAAADAGNLEKALEHATEVTLNHPDSEVAPDAMLIKADVEGRLGKKEIALETYRNLEQTANGSRLKHAARMGLMRTALESGRYSEVLVATDRINESSASTSTAELAEVKYSEGKALDALGRHDDAYKAWATISADVANLYGSMAAVSMAESLFANGSTKKAEQEVNRFLDANSPHNYWQARAFILLSDILRKQGKAFEADEYLDALRANYPGKEADIMQMIDTRKPQER